jgi:hypothetical protein
MERKELAEAYAVRLVDNMDTKDIMDLAIGYLSEEYKTYTLEELKTEIQDIGCFDDLLENC